LNVSGQLSGMTIGKLVAHGGGGMYPCQYCSESFPVKELTLDHVMPVSRGGRTEWENIVTACKKCNHSKGSKLITPNRLPWKPEYWHIVSCIREHHNFQLKHDSWDKYLG